MSTGHSLLAPSSADRWVKCPASISLGQQFPQLTEHPSGPEGEAAHWVAYAMVKSHKPAVGDLAPNGLAVTEEMVEGALLHVNALFASANPHGGLRRVRMEEREEMPSIHPQAFGTPDAVIDLADAIGEIVIQDYKFGHGEVEEFENWQLAMYTRGVLDRLGFDGHAEQHLKIRFRIVQPRCYTSGGPVREWLTTAGDLRAMWNKLRMAADEALGPDPSYRVGEQCTHCPGRRACSALKRAAGDAMDYAGTGQPVLLTGQDLGLELSFLERSLALLEARKSALAEQAEHAIRTGQSVPGYAIEPGKGGVKWNCSDAEIIALGDMAGVDLRKPAAPITPTQAKKKLDESVIAAYSERVPGQMKLVPANTTLAKKVFGK